MRNSLKLASFLLIALILNSCSISRAYKYDYGKKRGEFRYMDLKEKQFSISVDISSDRDEISISRDEISIRGQSKYNAPTWIKDTVSTVYFIEEKLSFPDGTILEKKSRPKPVPPIGIKCYDKAGKEIPCIEEFHICEDFKKKLRKNKYINLKIVYDLDSLGVVIRKEKKYTLVKRRFYRIAVH